VIRFPHTRWRRIQNEETSVLEASAFCADISIAHSPPNILYVICGYFPTSRDSPLQRRGNICAACSPNRSADISPPLTTPEMRKHLRRYFPTSGLSPGMGNSLRHLLAEALCRYFPTSPHSRHLRRCPYRYLPTPGLSPGKGNSLRGLLAEALCRYFPIHR
jgi:hypothetical protein